MFHYNNGRACSHNGFCGLLRLGRLPRVAAPWAIFPRKFDVDTGGTGDPAGGDETWLVKLDKPLDKPASEAPCWAELLVAFSGSLLAAFSAAALAAFSASLFALAPSISIRRFSAHSS